MIDVKKVGLLRKQEVVTHNGTKRTGLDPVTHALKLQALGVGEIVLNSVDRDGTMEGYDLELIEKIMINTSVPFTALGGAGNIEHIRNLFEKFHIIGAAAGSMFVFKGRFRAVLINYPSFEVRDVVSAGLQNGIN